MADSFPNPNAIPPRTSSTGLNGTFHPPIKPVLRPLSEQDWISKKQHNSIMSSTSAPSSAGINDTQLMNGTRYIRPTWTQEKEKVLLGPYDYLINQPGKDMRTQMIAAFNAWLKVPEKSLAIITKVVGMLHTASLLFVALSCPNGVVC